MYVAYSTTGRSSLIHSHRQPTSAMTLPLYEGVCVELLALLPDNFVSWSIVLFLFMIVMNAGFT